MTLRKEILEAAQWVQEQLDREPYAEAGFILVQSEGKIRRTDYSLTRKHAATVSGGRTNERNNNR